MVLSLWQPDPNCIEHIEVFMHGLSPQNTIHLHLHIVRPPSYILLASTLHSVCSPSYILSVPLFHTVRPPSFILSVPPLTYCSSSY